MNISVKVLFILVTIMIGILLHNILSKFDQIVAITVPSTLCLAIIIGIVTEKNTPL
jgi:hypothetical protein